MAGKLDPKVRIVKCPRCRKILPEPPGVPVYACGGCGAKLQAKKRNNSTVDATSQRSNEGSSGKQKVDNVFIDRETGSSSNQQSWLHSADNLDRNSHHNDVFSSNGAENGTVDAPPAVVEECSSENLKMKQLSDNDNQEPCCSSIQQSVANSSDEPDQNISNDPRSSTEFSGHGDPDSSPEATTHNRIDEEQENVAVVGIEHSSGEQVDPMNELDQNNDRSEHRSSSELSYHDDPKSSPEATVNTVVNHEAEFVSDRKASEIEESSSEFEESVANTMIVNDSDGGSKSSFQVMIAEKLLDTRRKKAVHLDEDDLLSEDGSAGLRHRGRFGRIGSEESMETARLGGVGYYGYDGSVSSFDGNDDQYRRKNHTGSIRDDEYVDSGHRNRFNRRRDHLSNGRTGKDEHRSTDVRSFYFNELHENPRHSPSMIPENPKMERMELLKLVQELQDRLERTKVSNSQQVSSYYNHVLHDLGRHGQRMAFSGEAMAVNGQRDGSSCRHCCPQDRHFSAQLPSHHVCCNGPSYGPRSYHSPRFSGPSSPRHNLSEFDFSAPDDHWQQNAVRKPFRSPKKKRYVRPIAGGSPWITCYRCFKLLQLPESFIFFNKKYHSLRCGACLKVLNFTLSDGTRVSRYYPEETSSAPPSSEAEDCGKPVGSWAGPVSCSDRSFEKSYSTETDGNGSRSRGFGEERKATMSRDLSGSTGSPSSRTSGRKTHTSEIKEVRAGLNGSPLHWLMGYASPSKVIRGS